MPDDPGADRIQREREQRRAAERARMEEARRARELELLRLSADGSSEATRVGDPEAPLITPHRERLPVTPADPAAPAPPRRERSRAIGGAVRSPAVEEFLRNDPTERFDLLALNAARFPPVLDAATDDTKRLAAVAHRVEDLMARVKLELDDPLNAGAFLRDQVLRWYRESPDDPTWTPRMTERWAGLFADSKTSGGRLQPWLNTRLRALRDGAVRAGGLGPKLKRNLWGNRRIDGSSARMPSEVLRAEVAQAVLDDLTAGRRTSGVPYPLVRLSELAVRRQVTTINDTLALLFSAPESGPFVILHPNRYPDCEELQIRPPTGGTTGAALAYAMVPGRPARRPAARGSASDGSAAEGAGAEGDAPSTSVDEEVDGTTIWDAESVSPATWRSVIGVRRREKRRLESPPKDLRSRAAYPVLRDLVIASGEFRKEFLAVRWRGRPAGLPLLVTLLQKGSIAPEVATDYEYLEAELGELIQGDAQWRPEGGVWSLPGWRITREGSHQDGFRYRAEPAE